MFDEQRDSSGLVWIVGCAFVVLVVLLLLIVLVTSVIWVALSSIQTPADESAAAAEAAPFISQPTSPPPSADSYLWRLVADGFDNPVFVTYAGVDSTRLYVVEQTGLIWVVENGQTLPEPFLDISLDLPDKLFAGGYSEQGLLGLAFHPEFASSGFFFISYTDRSGDTVIARYRVDRRNRYRADPTTRTVILTVDQPFEDHNGGHITFGPDGYLWIGLGDGGNVNEFNARSQQPDLLLGKLLRIDVDQEPYGVPTDNLYAINSAFLPEIWALGLRNPWRFSFDRSTHDLFIGDVGQWEWEEVNYLPAGTQAGANFGWSTYEGMHLRPDTPLLEDSVVFPILEYPHSQGCSVTGGYVYRGAAMPELNGYYFYGDYCIGRIWVAYRDGAGVWQTTEWMHTARQITSFGEDAEGELYLVDYKGDILRLEPAR